MQFSVSMTIVTACCAACILGGFPAQAAERLPASETFSRSLQRETQDMADSRSSETPDLSLIGHVSARVLDGLLHRAVTRKENVIDSILNMSTRGTADVDCQLAIELIPNSAAGHIRFLMSGHATMNDTIGTARSVRVYSSSRTQITGHKDVILDVQGLRLLPARAACRTSIQINRIDARNGFVERLAWRRVGQVQSQAEQIAALRASRRAERQMEAEFHRPLHQLQQKYAANVHSPLARNDIVPELLVATTREHLSFGLLARGLQGMQSPAPAPAYDLSLCVRDELVNGIADSLMSGETFTDRQFADLMQTLTGTIPRPLWVHARAEPWSVTAASQHPLTVSFDDDEVRVAFRIERAVYGDRELLRPLTISAAYSLEITRDGPRLVRVGDLKVEHSGPGAQQAIDSAEAQITQFLYRKFSGVFPAELYFDGLVPPTGGFWGRLRQLNLSQLACSDGWLAIGYEWIPDAPVTIVSAVR